MEVGVIGLGYVGLPLAIALSKKYKTFGFDINEERVVNLKKGVDINGDVKDSSLSESNINFTNDIEELKACNIFIIAVPTPVTEANLPDLSLLEKASEMVGSIIQKGSVVVFESTVYPGVTEKVCIPILEKSSGLKLNEDFGVGYSPERINPGDEVHTVETIVKVVSGSKEQYLETIADLYSSVIPAGVHKAPSIKVAEMAKVIENAQRDINIGFVNELKIICDSLDIDINKVLEAARTKWNFINFHPGLVGGHCIGVDPFYLAHVAQLNGINPEVILSGRRVNDSMAEYEATKVIKHFVKEGQKIDDLKLLVVGATFKPDVADLRNSKVEQFCKTLIDFGIEVKIHDPLIKSKQVFGIDNISIIEAKNQGFDNAIIAVNHRILKIPEGVNCIRLFSNDY